MAEIALNIKQISAAQPAALAAAQSAAHRGRFDEALDHLHAALRDNPELSPAHLLKGVIQWRREEYAASRQALEMAARLDAESIDAWHALAGVCRELKDFPAALRAVDEVLRREHDNAEAHLLRGEVLVDLQRPRHAKAALVRALKHKPTLTKAQLVLARLALHEGQTEAAYRRVKTVLQLGTQHYETSLDIGTLLAQLERRDEAIAHYRRLIREFPTRAEPYIKMAEMFVEEGHDINALPLLTIASRIEPKNTVSLLLLADLYRRQGRGDTADHLLQAARLAEPTLAETNPSPLAQSHVAQ